MTTALTFSPAEVAPPTAGVLAQLGMPEDLPVPERLEPLFAEAGVLFAAHVAPAAVCADIPITEFASVYEGEGRNAARSPVGEIFARADHLALFAITLGQPVSDALAQCFVSRDFALASILDAMASVAADGVADLIERRYDTQLRAQGWFTPDGAVLRYSPGYCGWHVTGQKRLFARLDPSPIGLSLTESSLMQPLKSVSGVLIAGPRRIHRFSPTYEFCEHCETRTCRARMRALFHGAASG
jgi:hypothetical protein